MEKKHDKVREKAGKDKWTIQKWVDKGHGKLKVV